MPTSGGTPIRVKMRSAGDRVACAAGTQHPIWAMMVATQLALRSVDFPPMFGPVNSRDRASSSLHHAYNSCSEIIARLNMPQASPP